MAPPVCTDDQILPRIRWVPIGKSNCYLDMVKSQDNPIYKIAVDLLKNTNFFRAFTASSTISSIYIQQFWDTIQYDKTAGCYRCQLDEQWFVLTKDTLREALQITSVNSNQAFNPPPTADALINFVNELGYLKRSSHISHFICTLTFTEMYRHKVMLDDAIAGNNALRRTLDRGSTDINNGDNEAHSCRSNSDNELIHVVVIVTMKLIHVVVMVTMNSFMSNNGDNETHSCRSNGDNETHSCRSNGDNETHSCHSNGDNETHSCRGNGDNELIHVEVMVTMKLIHVVVTVTMKLIHVVVMVTMKLIHVVVMVTMNSFMS
nr:hypothetical protein [Tanacetum cinerariifolium]